MKTAGFRRDPDLPIRCLPIDDHLAAVVKFEREDPRIDLAVDIGIGGFKRIFDRRQDDIHAIMKIALFHPNGAIHTRDTILSTPHNVTRYAPFHFHSIRIIHLLRHCRLRAERRPEAPAGPAQERFCGGHAMSIELADFSVSRDAASGELKMEGVALKDVAARFGTPCFVYSEAALTNAFRQLDGALKSARGDRPYLICYAVKANSNLAVLNLFARLGAGFDIVSGGELRRVLRAGGDPCKVVFSGLGKSSAEMKLALEADIKCFNVESESELERLNDVAATLGKKARISLRVNPDVDAKTHPYISTGLKNNKFGVAYDRALLVYRKAASLAHIEIAGVDCHIGSQLIDDAPLREAMTRIVALADTLKANGIPVHHVCPGGGIGIRYRNEATISLDAYARALQESLGDRSVELLLEPGRMLVGNAGVLLSRVEYVKPTATKNFLVVDAAMNDLIRPPLYQAYHEVVEVQAGAAGGTPARIYDVVGPVCESTDVLAHERNLKANAGDLVALLSAGAYSFVMSSNYNSRPRASEVMISGDTMREVRARETFDMLIAGETT